MKNKKLTKDKNESQHNLQIFSFNTLTLLLNCLISFPSGGGGVVLPIVAYTGRLCPKGVPFSGFRYIKG